VTDLAIAAVGAYAPHDRLPAAAVREALGRFEAAGVERTAVPAVDEDALTMAHEAAERALTAAAIDRSTLTRLAVATTTPPVDEEDLTPRLVSTLGLEPEVETGLLTGSTHAGCSALSSGLEAPGPALVIASDAPRGAPDDAIDHAGGAGAVAFVLAPEGGASVVDQHTVTNAYPGTRFRARGDAEPTGLGITAYDRQAFAETIGATADGVETDEVDAVAVQAPDGKRPYRAAGRLGVGTDAIQRCATVHELGDTGAASALLSLAVALEDGAERVLVAGYGSGAVATTMVVARDETVEVDLDLDAGEELTYTQALRRRGTLSSGEPAGGGAYVSIPTWRRSLPQRHRLEAGVCPDCAAVTFPPEGVCDGCGDLVTFTVHPLPGTGTVEAVTTIQQGGAPPEFVDQQARSGPYQSAIVSFDAPGGETVSIPAQVVGEVAVGDRVETVIRRIYAQEDVIRYGFKIRRRPHERTRT